MQTRLGREDSEYLARSVPFYAANQPLADISEMRVVQGMDAGLYQKLKPLVCALPMTRQQININTLDVTQSVILEALFDPWLSPVQARALLQQRPAKGWEDVDQFLAQPLLADVDERTKKQLKTVLSVDSNYFWLRSDITVNEIELTMNSLIVRMGPQHFSRFAPPIPSAGSAVHPTWNTVSGLTLLTNSFSNGCKPMRFDSTFPANGSASGRLNCLMSPASRYRLFCPPYWKKS